MNSKYRLSIAILLLLSFGLCTPGKAEIYRWIGSDGKWHFGDKLPEGNEAKRVESFHGGASVSFMGGGAATSARVRIFVTQQCPYCKKAKSFLRQRGTPFEELDVEASTRAKAEYSLIGGKGVPVILVGKQRMDGFDAAELESLLANAGL